MADPRSADTQRVSDSAHGEFRGKVALVTGAGRGIGAAVAQRVALGGGAVVCAARSAGELTAVVEAIVAQGGDALAVPSDLVDEDAVRALVGAAVQHYGRLDLAVNNAGAWTSGLLHETATEDFDHVVAVNLRGTFLCLKYEIAEMLKTGGGAIVNTASVAGVIGNYSMSPYTATKHGVVGLTRAAALDYADRGIRVNCLAPGPTATVMTMAALNAPEKAEGLVGNVPMGRLADPSEIADATAFLLSSAASFITGATLLVDGGRVFV